MIKNYNSLSSGRDTWLKNDVGDQPGSLPPESTKVTRSWWLAFMCFVLTMLSGQDAISQSTIQIGSGAATSPNFPITAYYGYSYSQQIVTAAEYVASNGIAGNITKIRFYLDTSQPTLTKWNNWTIYLGLTSKTSFTSNTNWVPLTSLTQVYSGTFTPAVGWNEFTFSAPFAYTAGSNIVVAVDENASSYADDDVLWKSYTSTSNSGIYYRNDTTNPNPSSPPTAIGRSASIAQIQFFGAVSACTPPSALSPSPSSPTEANLVWTASESSPSGGYQWEVRTSGTGGSGATGLSDSGFTGAGVVTANTSLLTASTTYTMYVRSDCGSGVFSNWAASSTFKTPCLAVSVPYTENFQSVTVPAIPDCESIQTLSGNAWKTVSNPGYGFTSKTLQYTYSASQDANAWFYTKGISMTAGTNYIIAYRYGNSGYTESLKVAYGTTPNASAMTNAIADYPSVPGSTAQAASITFSPPTTGIYYFGFNAYSIADQYNLFVDDISIILGPTCSTPTALSAFPSATSATFSWSAPNTVPALGYEYAVSTSATPPASGTAVTGTTVAVSTLEPSTAYYMYLRSACTAGTDYSDWISITFNTPCAPVDVPYVEDFSTATLPAPPACTAITNEGDGNSWETSADTYTGLFPASQGNYLFYGYNEDYAANTWFYTRGINLIAGTQYRISYRYGSDALALYPERMKVAYGMAPASASMTNAIADHSDIETTNNINTVTFSPSVSGVYYFGFNCYSNYDMDLLQLDDIVVELLPSCLEPTALTASNVTFTSADLSWTAPSTAPGIGYEWTVTTSATPPASGTPISGTSASISNLTPDTTYYLHVRLICSESDSGAWATTSFQTGYCVSTSTAPGDGYISSFQTTTGFSNISNTSTFNVNGYSNFTALSAASDAGSSLSFSLIPNTGTTYYFGVSIFVDWNNDLDFDDANERVYSAPTETAISPCTGSFAIPAGTAIGNYRMRVKLDYINYLIQVPACGTNAGSETEDYTLSVVPTPTCFAPTVVTPSNITAASATISWGAATPVPGVGYEWTVSTSATPPASGASVTGTSVSVSDLSANTTYYFHIRSECTAGSDYSLWNTISFNTACNPVTTLPQIEGFENAGIPSCWSASGTGGAWAVSPAFGEEIPAPHSGTNFAGVGWTGSTISALLVSSAYDLSAYPANQARVNVWIYRNDTGTAADAIKLYVNTSPSLTAAASLLTIPLKTTSAPAVAAEGWYSYTANIPLSYNTGGLFYVIINGTVGSSYSSYSVGVDDYSIEFVPPSITSFTPETVCEGNEDSITITGANLTGATDVLVNGVSVASFEVVNDTTITAILTPETSTGAITVINSISSATSAGSLTVNPYPVVSDIVSTTGTNTLCIGETTLDLDNTTPGNDWQSLNPEIAVVDGDGIVTGIAPGTATITYSATNNGCTSSKSFSVEVNEPAAIDVQPSTQTTVTGDDSYFSVTAHGTGIAYRWMMSSNGGDDFSYLDEAAPYSGTDTNTLHITGTPGSYNLNLYRVEIVGTDPCGSAISNPATLNVGDTGIGAAPGNVSICGSGTANFSIVATGDVVSIVWQEDRGLGFATIPADGTIDGLTYSGSNSLSGSLDIAGVTPANSGWKYRAVISGVANSVTSTAGILTVGALPVVSAPSDQTVCSSGGSVSFTSNVTDGLGYQWQYSADGINDWANVANSTPAGVTYANADTATLNVTTIASTPASGAYYRLVVSSAAPCSDVISSNAKLIINNPTVSAQPVPAAAFAGSTATFSVATDAPSPSFQWQYSANGTTWSDVAALPAGVTYSGATTATLTVMTSTSAAAGTPRYRAVITSNSCSVNSDAAMLTITNYCVPSATATTTYVSAFATQNGVTNITNNSGGSSAGGYGNFANLSASQIQGGTVNFTATTATPNASTGTAIWIDWNQNGAFENPGERVYLTTGSSTSLSGSFVVPNTALTGSTRMRILVDRASTNPSPCTISGTRGEAEDYTFTVLVPPPCDGIPVAGTVTANTASFCMSGSAILSVAGYSSTVSGIGFQWYSTIDGLIPDATGTTYTTPVLTSANSYFVRVSCLGSGQFADSNTIAITINNPSVDSTTPGTRCGKGTVNLAATTSGNYLLNWYATATGGSPLYTGSTFTSPSLDTGVTTYYVAASTAAPLDVMSYCIPSSVSTSYYISSFSTTGGIDNITNVGTGQSASGYGNYTSKFVKQVAGSSVSFSMTGASSNTYGMKVWVDWNNDGDFDDSGETVYTSAGSYVTTATGAIAVPAGTLPGNYRMRAKADYVYQANSGTTFTSCNNTDYLEVEDYTFTVDGVCESPRAAVTATVTIAPTLTLSSNGSSICSGNTTENVTITSPLSNFDSYSWIPNTDVTGTAATGYSFNPTATTAYTLTASEEGGCVNTAIYTVTVNPLPSAITVTPATSTVCEGSVQALTIGSAGGTATFGAGTTAPSATSYPNPLSAYYGGVKHQILFTPAELSAQGLLPGSTISALTFYLNNFAANACTDFTIRMGATTNTDLSGFVSGTTTVYGPLTFTPSATGLKSFTLTTPYVWDGISGLIVETVHNAGNGGNGNGTRTRTTTTTNNSVFYGAKDDVAGGIAGFDATTITVTGSSTLRPNMTFTFANAAPTWTPITGLYTNAAGTTPYTGAAASTVYAKPTGTTTYTATKTTAAGCSITSTATVTVSPATVGGAVTASATTLCQGSTSGLLSLSGHIGNVLRWESSVAPFSVWTPIANTDATYTSGALAQTTRFRAVVKSGECMEVNSGEVEITINQVTFSSVTSAEVCLNTDAIVTVNGLVPNSAAVISYTKSGVSQTPVLLTADATGSAYFNVPVTGAGQNVVVTSIQRTDVAPSCTIMPTTNNRVNFVLSTGCAAVTTCGITLPTIDAYVYTNIVANAQSYTWRVTTLDENGQATAQVQSNTTVLRNLKLTSLGSYAFKTTYRIEVSVKRNNVQGPYGTACNVTTPEPKTALANCDATLTSINDIVYANLISFATGYAFRITETEGEMRTQTVNKALRSVKLTDVTAFPILYGATYSVEVAVRNTDGTYLDFGTLCMLHTPVYPSVFLEQCATGGTVIPSNSTQIYASSYANATGYIFNISNADSTYNHSVAKVLRVFKLSDFPALAPGEAYSVRVKLLFNGETQDSESIPSGKPCTIITPLAGKLAAPSKGSAFNAVAYPNPFAENFNIDVTTANTDKVSVKVYDMTGRLLESHTDTVSEFESLKVGDRYPAGVYNVIVTQGDNIKTLRVIKR